MTGIVELPTTNDMVEFVLLVIQPSSQVLH